MKRGNSGQEIPLIRTPVPAGFPSPAGDYIEERIDLNKLLIKTPSATFFVRVEGESMTGAFIPARALLVVDRSTKAASGDIIVAVVDGEFTVKRLMISAFGTYLYPENKNFTPMQIKEGMEFQVWGVVSKIIIDPKENYVRTGGL